MLLTYLLTLLIRPCFTPLNFHAPSWPLDPPMSWWRSFGKTRLGSSFFWEVLRRNPGRITVLCLIGIQTVFAETNGPTVKQRAAQHRG